MTLPDERYRAIKYAHEFLRDLLNPKKTPRVPRAIRDRAYRVLRHFPHEYELKRLAKRSPDIIDSGEEE